MTARRWRPAFSWLDVKLGLRMMRKYPGVCPTAARRDAAGRRV